MQITRRKLNKTLGLGVIMATIGGKSSLIHARDAVVKQLPLKLLNNDEACVLETLSEILIPGAKTAGIKHYLDYHLSVPTNESLLFAQYFNVAPPYYEFYRSGIKGINSLSKNRTKKEFCELTESSQISLIKELQSNIDPNTLLGWDSEVSPWLFYLSLRSDALDIVYGTPEGFEQLQLPYMAHIMPPRKW